jgi:two-component system secretion response regulator SsrB
MTNNISKNILILSYELIYVEALKSLLSSGKNQKINGFYIQSPKIQNKIKNQNAELILLDTEHFTKNSWEFLKETHVQNPSSKIVILANNNEPNNIELAKKHGAFGFVLKSSPLELLIAALKIVENGNPFYDTGNYNFSKSPNESSFELKYRLTKREMQIASYMIEGNSSRKIAEKLELSFHTIEAHRKNIYKKLEINKITQLINLYSEFK